jgi:hypothetical protein
MHRRVSGAKSSRFTLNHQGRHELVIKDGCANGSGAAAGRIRAGARATRVGLPHEMGIKTDLEQRPWQVKLFLIKVDFMVFQSLIKTPPAPF